MLNPLQGRNLRARLTQPLDELWDRRLGVSTFGHHPATGAPGDREWYVHYIPSPYRDILEVLRVAKLSGDDVFTDLGCGLGRVVFTASWLGARRATGVELVPWLADGAKENRRRCNLQGHDIEFFEANALHHNLSETTLLYMFHPFGGQILADVIAKARTDRKAAGNSRALRIAYVNPVCEDVLSASGWLRRTHELPARKQRFSSALHYNTTFWESTE
jgi:predicted RNA methylase